MGLDHGKLKETRAGTRAGIGWKAKAGENRIRVLPPHSEYLGNLEALRNLAIPYKIHFFRVQGRPTEVSRCLEEQEPKTRCPACDAWRVYRNSEDVALKKLAGDIAPADQYLFNILDLGNIQAGIQYWASNWTCWDKIMEIAANPAWGDVIDPANGVNFIVTLTPGDQTRSGYNQYSVLPEPQRTTVMEILATIPEWQVKLDDLEAQKTEFKGAQEIRTLLDEMGFPPARGAAAPTPATPGAAAPPQAVAGMPPPLTAAPTPAGPSPVAAPAGPAVIPPGATSVPPAAATAAPQPVAGAATPPQPAAAPPPPAQAAGPVHYDPGPQYNPKYGDAERPAGVPRCYGDFEPEVHRCAPCPVQTECQLDKLGLDK